MMPRITSLYDLLQNSPAPGPVWAVDLERQEIHRQVGETTWDTAAVSTSRFGTGNEPDSNRTPTGWHQVTEIIGTGGPLKQEYLSRKPVPSSRREDRILARILWLDGLEPGLNTNSHSRYIYIHGTNHPNLLGSPASWGCIRMAPETIAEWVDALQGKPPVVWIGKLDGATMSTSSSPEPD